jgi:hypothetical protein
VCASPVKRLSSVVFAIPPERNRTRLVRPLSNTPFSSSSSLLLLLTFLFLFQSRAALLVSASLSGSAIRTLVVHISCSSRECWPLKFLSILHHNSSVVGLRFYIHRACLSVEWLQRMTLTVFALDSRLCESRITSRRPRLRLRRQRRPLHACTSSRACERPPKAKPLPRYTLIGPC